MPSLYRLVLVGVAVLAAAPAVAQQTTPIQEWNVPWANTRPRDPYLDRQGRVWFVGQVGDYVGVLDPRSGEFKKYDLAPHTGPHNLILDATGIVWYSGNASAHIHMRNGVAGLDSTAEVETDAQLLGEADRGLDDVLER